ncbi:type III-B CRISPR module-associated Cmr3 family protein [Nitrincola tapanii]|uniref:CRISPR-associated protein Csx10 n=1 Tax=Nitrincola tapanii TaxID=1708751 RepID=A0A5A9W1W5_9GAMM|nr:type III-B CRISPR module-associated Cmr3 family protein [Nitrincola tapanii]KAA0874790.1 hypothetical protein E1H14_08230 [Nitrincola tapanii]
MKLTQTFKVTLLQDLILSARAATEGGHEGLDYIPGANFLGAVAGKLYPSLNDDEAFALFHSGSIRFGDALPLTGDMKPCWPVPLSLHAYKGESYKEPHGVNSRFRSGVLFDPALQTAAANNRQPKQVRKGYCSAAGDLIEPLSQLHVKTALNAETNRAAEGQLFSYQSLCAGQEYYLVLQAESDYPELFQQVCECLLGELRLGRSRSAQFGKVKLEILDLKQSRPESAAGHSEELTLWLLSDLALLDPQGQPTLIPDAHSLGLPEGTEWLVEKSYLRSRRYSTFNGYRRSYDTERQVISRGSVLRYRLAKTLESEELQRLQQIGLYQEQGLGAVAVNPTLLKQSEPAFAPSSPVEHLPKAQKIQLPTGNAPELIRALQRRMQGSADSERFTRVAEAIFTRLLDMIVSARSWAGLLPGELLQDAPGRSQWGNIRALANDNRDRPQQFDEAFNRLLDERSAWKFEVSPNRKFSSCLKRAVHESCDEYSIPQEQRSEVLARVAVLAGSEQWQQALEGRLPSEIQGEPV